MYEWKGDDAPPGFNAEAANNLVGKYILVGITYCDHSGQEMEKVQMHGVIESASHKGVVIALRGVHEGKRWTMPPDLRSISEAKPGKYNLHTTGEVVTDPDLLSTWTVTKPAKH